MDRLLQYITKGGWRKLGSRLPPGSLPFIAVVAFALFPTFPFVLLGLSFFLILFMIVNRVHAKQHQAAIEAAASERRGESICTFARSFDRYEADTRILRAVYEELAQSLEYGTGRVPVRSSDLLFDGPFQFDEEDFELTLDRIASQCGRSLESWEDNPIAGKARTVGDLVAFLSHQPQSGDPDPDPTGATSAQLWWRFL